MRDVQRLIHHCQKVLPLVYDDSLSYYEVLCKVVQKVNEVISGLDENNEEVRGLKADVAEMRVILENIEPATFSHLGTVIPDKDTMNITDVGVLSPKVASDDSLGIVMPDGVTIVIDESGKLTAKASYVPTATRETLGVVRIDDVTVHITEDGSLYVDTPKATNNSYGTVQPDNATTQIVGGLLVANLPTEATADKSGIVKPDNSTIKVTEEGVISVPIATNTRLGVVKVDDITVNVDEGGRISVPVASNVVKGVVRADNTTIVNNNGVLSSLGGSIATYLNNGISKPDGITVTVDADGTLHAINGGTVQNLNIIKVAQLPVSDIATFPTLYALYDKSNAYVLYQYDTNDPKAVNGWVKFTEAVVVNDGITTIKLNGATVGFTSANQQTDKEINIVVDKTKVGLANVDNTSDSAKPVSTAQRTAIDTAKSEAIAESRGTILEGTLSRGSVAVTFTSTAIDDTKMYDIYTDVYGISPIGATVNGDTLTLNFKEQEADVSVKVVIK